MRALNEALCARMANPHPEHGVLFNKNKIPLPLMDIVQCNQPTLGVAYHPNPGSSFFISLGGLLLKSMID